MARTISVPSSFYLGPRQDPRRPQRAGTETYTPTPIVTSTRKEEEEEREKKEGIFLLFCYLGGTELLTGFRTQTGALQNAGKGRSLHFETAVLEGQGTGTEPFRVGRRVDRRRTPFPGRPSPLWTARVRGIRVVAPRKVREHFPHYPHPSP